MKEFDGIFSDPCANADVEWLETNNSGAFCSSTIIEKHSRKYHGLLVTPVKGHEGRFHILSAVDATLNCSDGFQLGTTAYPNAVYPEGWKNLEKMELLPIPAWTYENDEVAVLKEIFMRNGEPAVWIAYTLIEGPDQTEADLKFLFTYRNSHSLTARNNDINTEMVTDTESLRIRPYEGLPEAEISFSGEWTSDGELYWDNDICYEREKERGLDWVEDRFVPGNIQIKLRKNKAFIIRVGIENDSAISSATMEKIYQKEKRNRLSKIKRPENAFDLLKLQGRHFLLKNPSGKQSINAGYPWFGEWGRDTMISLPGLTCYNGEAKTGVDILSDYISMIKDGLLPNTLGETQGFTSYNSIDAGLLFCWAINKLIASGYGRLAPEKKVLTSTFRPAVQSIINAFLENMVSNAHITAEGMLYSGTPETQLTWMDATAYGHPVTPRYGFAVDLNALWYDALCLLKELNSMSQINTSDRVEELINDIPESFQQMFWLEKEGYLTDTVNENGPDYKLRPNMLFASSASDGLLKIEQRRAVVDAAERHLLTEFGMRTLAPTDPDFKPEYSGGADERDSRYHQGTVWPWPLGIMIESSLLTAVDIAKKCTFWSHYIENMLEKHLCRDGWGFVSEIFDGMKPCAGKGSFAQAWSSSEIIRAAELIKRIPEYEKYK